MKNGVRRFSVVGCVLGVGLVWAQLGLAWGSLGHRIIGQVASEIAEDGQLFWGANEQAIGVFSNTPDVYWKKGAGAASEKPTHWFHFDFYSPDGSALPAFFKVYREVVARYSDSSVQENGTGPWRVEQFYAQALEDLKAARYSEALQFAGAMSHYVGDLAQPLHVTRNYDGQLTEQTGIHSFFESQNLEQADLAELKAEVMQRAEELLQDQNYRAAFEGDLMRSIFLSTSRSLTRAKEILQNDKRLGRAAAAHIPQLEIAAERLADGAATYALILSKLWREGGQRDAERRLTPKQPDWVAPDYSQVSGSVAGQRQLVSLKNQTARTRDQKMPALNDAKMLNAPSFPCDVDAGAGGMQ